MRRYLLVALWPAGLAAIAAATARAARRATPAAVPASGSGPAQDSTAPASYEEQGTKSSPIAPASYEEQGTKSSPIALAVERDPSASPLEPVPDAAGRRAELDSGGPSTMDILRLGAVSCAGGLVAYEVMALVGPAIVNNGLLVDEPIHDWINDNQVRSFAAVMNRFNKVGNTWTTWGAAGTAAVCLGVTWPRQKWLPPSTLGAAILVDHFATLALRHKFHRPGPPTSPLGTYPSGGCDRVILFYGLIAYLLWREFSGTRRGKVLSFGGVAALAFIESYCRAYLSKHWFTDIVSGLFYGGVLLVPFVAAIRLIAGPAKKVPAVEPLPGNPPSCSLVVG